MGGPVKLGVPANELRRQLALRAYCVLDTPAEPAFDHITRLASHVCQCPISIISFIDRDREWVKSKVGVDFSEISREVSFCSFAILQSDVFVIPDTRFDERFSSYPLVTSPPHFRFYAGVPLITTENYALGALCVADYKPRELNYEQIDALRTLAQDVLAHLELGRHDAGQDPRERKERYEGVSKNVPIGPVVRQERVGTGLQFSEMKFRSSEPAVREGMILADVSGRILLWKRSAESIFGFAEEEVLGKPLTMLMPERYREAHQKGLERVRLTGESRIIGRTVEVYGMRKDGSEFPVELSVTTWRAKEREYYSGVLRDVSERKEVELMKNELISIVSHELRSPLTAIRGSLTWIIEKHERDVSEGVKKLIDVASRSSQRMMRLINDILDVDKVESGKINFHFEPLEVMPLVKEAIEVNQPIGDQYGVKLVLANTAPDAWVTADADRLTQVITNLLSNAVKFSPPNETVTVSVSRQNSIRVSVTDRGPGIPAPFRARVFQRFAQADSPGPRRKGGSGLGLCISKALIEKMGGRIGFETEIDLGTTFFFDLPEFTRVTDSSN